MKNKHIHFIGICGVAMSALAIAFHKKGYKVTGSDKGFYPPVSTYLKNTDIDFYPGWHPEKMTKEGDPDLVVVGNVAGSNNPEWNYVKENDIEYKSYPELIDEYLICDNSIVCAGTYGKTTSSTLLSWILEKSEWDPNYMFGGLAANDFPAAKLGEEKKWSITEGDEYKSARWDMQPKFKHYSPTHLLLTSVIWDHADIYSTEEKYINTFLDLVESIPEDGLAILSSKADKVLSEKTNKEYITYGNGKKCNYKYTNFKQNESGIKFNIEYNNNSYEIENQMLGEYMAENITGCFAMAHQIGLKPQKIISAIKSFQGIKRRLERRLKGKVDVYDDIAHSPEKAKSVLSTLNKIYDKKITAVFEPNTGNRKKKSIPSYKNAFKGANEVIIPRLSKIKKKKNDPDPPFYGEKLKEVIAKTHDNVKHIDDDFELVDHLISTSKQGGAIVFLGSHGFRKMIEMTVNGLD